MTIDQAIAEADELRPNAVSVTTKRRWLSRLDSLLETEVFDRFVGGHEIEHDDYTDETPGLTVLLCPDPYSDIYPAYIAMQCELQDGQAERYNNMMDIFTVRMEAFRAYWNRTHERRQAPMRYY